MFLAHLEQPTEEETSPWQNSGSTSTSVGLTRLLLYTLTYNHSTHKAGTLINQAGLSYSKIIMPNSAHASEHASGPP